MLFNSLQYMLFLPIVVMILFLLPGKFRQLWLLAVSYYFYMCWNIKYIFIIVAITLITYMSGIILEHVDKPENKRVIVILGSVFSLLFVFIFKYLNFFMENVRIMLGRMGIQMYDNQFDIMSIVERRLNTILLNMRCSYLFFHSWHPVLLNGPDIC